MRRYDTYDEEPRAPKRRLGLGAWIGLGVVGVILFVIVLGFLFSIKGVDSGQIAFVREGGPFDGRNVTDVRQPGSGPSSIGIWNKQDELPVTERDLTDEIESIVVPSRDGVDMVVNGQALFRLTTDEARAKEFYLKYGRRKWEGNDLTSEQGWSSFLRIRLIPILQDTLRQTIGTYDCVELKNTCVYVLEADKLAEDGGSTEVADKAKEVNNTQTIQLAQDSITKLLQAKLVEGLGGGSAEYNADGSVKSVTGGYFEGVRFQNLKPDFTPEIAQKVREAQGKRAEVATTRLEAQRLKEEAAGAAQAEFEKGKGQRLANEERAKGLKALSDALKDPGVAAVEKIKALCGVDADGQPKGCANLQVLGSGDIINSLK